MAEDDEFEDVWAHCAPLLEPALDPTWTLEDVKREILARRAVLWPMAESAVVTRLHSEPRGDILRVWLAGGKLDELQHYLSVADDYAREQGCRYIEIEGRAGWERVLDGYEKTRVILVKEV